MNKRVCFILPTLHAGGVENYCLRFLKNVQNKFDVTIISLNTERGDLHEDFERLGVKVIYEKVGYLNIFGLRKIYRIFKRYNFGTLVDFTGNFAGIRMVVAKLAGVGNRIVFYRRSSNSFKRTLLKVLYDKFENRMVYIFATKVFSNSKHAFQCFFPNKYSNDKRFKVIPNGVDMSMFQCEDNKTEVRQALGIPVESFVVGHIGRFDAAKNHETIFKVANEMMKQSNDVVFVFCGRGTDGTKFKNMLEKMCFPERIISLGLQSNLGAVLKSMDIFYFPSITEGQPNALIEAMLAGLPIIASNIEPIKEATPPDAHPLLLDPLEVNKVVEALLCFKTNPDKQIKTYKQWAQIEFDHTRNFKLFENEIENY